MNYYPRYPSHYLAATLQLSMAEDGAYTRLMDWYYSNEKPIPHEARYAIGRASNSAEKQAINSVLDHFFLKVDGCWVQKRIQEEIEKAAVKIDASRNNGLRGGRPRKEPQEKKPTGLFSENLLGSQNKTQTLTQKKAPQSPVLNQEQEHRAFVLDGENPVGSRFDEFWAAYPVKKGKQKARATWDRRKLDRIADHILADVDERKRFDRQWLEGYEPHASTYVNQSGWEDAIDRVRPPPEKPASKQLQGLQNLMRGVNGHGNERTDGLSRSDDTSRTEQAVLPQPRKNTER